MNAWRRLAVLCAGGRLFESGAAMNFRETVGARALTLFGLIDRKRRGRQRHGIQGLRGAEPVSDLAEVDFAPDTDVQVFFMDSEPAPVDGSASVEKPS